MDDELRAYLEAMETRLMIRINDNQEGLIERMRQFEMTMSALMDLNRNTNNLLTLIVGVNTDLVKRMTDLEKKS
jgi:hypothetical protein